jgi:biofilm PGA synthesis N-glycosyltransferase PgaC
METLFWISAVLILYVYLGYPAALAVWARVAPAPVRREEGRELPGVSIVLAARNEEARLRARLDNLLSLDYPAELRQIIVVSDGSDDGTLDVIRSFGDAVESIAITASGKPAALNAGVARARYELLLFADARQMFARDALRHLVADFSDPAVGAVSGELVFDRRRTRRPGDPLYVVACESTIAEGVGIYWRYEKWLRRHESLVGSTLGATGAIYAMRRSLWRELPEETLVDDVLTPMRVVLSGKRVVFEPRAQAVDVPAADGAAEMRRKVRTLAGNYQILTLEPRLLVPFVNPVWLQYVSHKIGRLVVPYALVCLLVTSVVMASRHFAYAGVLTAQVLLYALAGYGAYLNARPVAGSAATPPPVPAGPIMADARARSWRARIRA